MRWRRAARTRPEPTPARAPARARARARARAPARTPGRREPRTRRAITDARSTRPATAALAARDTSGAGASPRPRPSRPEPGALRIVEGFHLRDRGDRPAADVDRDRDVGTRLTVDPSQPDRRAERVAVGAARHAPDPTPADEHGLTVPEHRFWVLELDR